MPAATRIHCSNQLDTRRERDMRIGAGHIDAARLKRLPERIEHRALEFGQFVEEKDPKVRQADLTGLDLEPAAGQRRHARRMVGAAERTRTADPPAFEHRSEEHTSELQSLMRISYA